MAAAAAVLPPFAPPDPATFRQPVRGILHPIAPSGRAASPGTRVSAESAVAPSLHLDTGMAAEPNSFEDISPITYQFTVLRGMTVALVIETRDWYSGLLQAALARIRLEGQN